MQYQSTTPLEAERSRPEVRGRTVLVADDNTTVLRVVEARCRQLGLQVETATDGLGALLKVKSKKPDLLILDLNLPDVEGFRVVERLTDPKYPPLPVIVLTGRSDNAAMRRCEGLGVLYVYKGPNAWEELEPLILKVFRDQEKNEPDAAPPETSPAASPTILLVDDDQVARKSIAPTLRKYRLRMVEASNGMQGFWLALKEQPNVVVTDWNMEQGSGHYLLSRIKGTPATRHIPVIVYTAEGFSYGQRVALERELRGRGQAAAFLDKPFSTARFIEELSRHIPSLSASMRT